MAKSKYSKLVGLWKSVKNVLVVWGIPAALFLLNNWLDWVPTKYQASLTPVMGCIAYFVKNWVQNKDK